MSQNCSLAIQACRFVSFCYIQGSRRVISAVQFRHRDAQISELFLNVFYSNLSKTISFGDSDHVHVLNIAMISVLMT
jgi:hypothetical protein